MKRLLLCCALVLASLPLPAAQQPHSLSTEGDHFTLDGRPFKVLSGELHYARIPREYWHARLKMAKAMGLNTIATYVFWNVHEPTPGRYDFSGNNDLAAFIKAAQEEGLYVILRAGPYSCAEWEFGGFPAWLLKDQPAANAEGPHSSGSDGHDEHTSTNPGFPLRSNDPAFMVPTERWIHRLGQEVASLQIGHGGPILMTQVENEYGNFGADHAYMEHLRQIFLDSGFNASLLYTADNWRNIDKGSIPELLAATNFGIGNHQGGMDALAKVRPDGPLFVSEYWPGWFDHWGHPHETRPIAPQLEDLDYILHRGTGINIYMLHGGTSFAFMSGSSWTNNQFLPDVTSYDYDAPLDEAGHPTPKYFAYRKVLAKYACSEKGEKNAVILSAAKNPRISPAAPKNTVDNQDSDSCLPPIPSPPPVITIPQITLTESTPLWQNLPTPITADQPQSMEQYGQSYGYILYRTQLPSAVSGDLVLNELHDYAQIYLDGKLIGTLDRRDKQNTLPITTSDASRLDILVANDGRINSTRMMRTEQKGITQSVTLAGKSLTGWQVYPLPMNTLPGFTKPHAVILSEAKNPRILSEAPQGPTATPTFFRGHFTLTTTGDTFLDIRNLGKGALWINGHPIGRFWNIGPQQTLYVPGPWLRKGTNEIVVFDLAPTSPQPHVAGLDHPILDGPVSDKTGSKQE